MRYSFPLILEINEKNNNRYCSNLHWISENFLGLSWDIRHYIRPLFMTIKAESARCLLLPGSAGGQHFRRLDWFKVSNTGSQGEGRTLWWEKPFMGCIDLPPGLNSSLPVPSPSLPATSPCWFLDIALQLPQSAPWWSPLRASLRSFVRNSRKWITYQPINTRTALPCDR